MKITMSLFLILFWSVLVRAEVYGTVDKVYDGRSKRKSLSAVKKEIFKKSIEDVIGELVIEMIGEEKFQRHRGLIHDKVFKASGKYISYVKAEKPQRQVDHTAMSISMKISLDNLHGILLENGLLYKSDGAPVILPMLSYVDRVNLRTFKWWVDREIKNKVFLSHQDQLFNETLRATFFKKGFHVLNPVKMNLNRLIPEFYRTENPKTQFYLSLGGLFSTQLVTHGRIWLEPSETNTEAVSLRVKLIGMHSSNGRVIAEVSRRFETDPGSFEVVVRRKMKEVVPKLAEDFSVQVLESWQKGTFGASLLRLAISGPIHYPLYKQLKDLILRNFKEVRSIKERYFSRQKVEFEIDVSTSAKALAEKFKNFQVGASRLKVDSIKKNRIELSL